jgi:hypothetical protein
MGYAQLVQRQSQAEAPHLRPIGIILSEAERMAGIVKKIGRLTKYETIDYVGSARMIDLDRSAASDPSLVIPDPPDEATTRIPAASDGTVSGELVTGDDDKMTREFTAVQPPPEVLAAAGDLGELFDDGSGPSSTERATPPRGSATPTGPQAAVKKEAP